jgi:hypothetical protein
MSPLWKYSVRSLTGRPLTTSFAIMCMTLVSFTTSGLWALTRGLEAVVNARQPPGLVLLMAHGSTRELDSRIPFQAVGRLTSSSHARRYSVETLLFTSLPPQNGEPLDYLTLRGMDPAGFAIHEMELVSGKMPSAEAEELLIGASLLRHYPRLAVGTTFEVHRKYKFVIVGVFETHTVLDDELWTLRSTLARRENEQVRSSVNVVYVEADSPQQAEALVNDVRREKDLRIDAELAGEWRRRVAENGFGPTYRWLKLIIALIAIAALLAATGQLTVLFFRRIGDISVLRAIGFRLPRVILLVASEIELVVLVGAGLGLSITTLAIRGRSLQAAGEGVGANFEASLTPTVFAGTLAGMLAVGVLASIWPVIQLMRKQIRDGLR